MLYPYPTLCTALEAAGASPERTAALERYKGGLTHSVSPDGTITRVASCQDFTMTLQYSPVEKHWGVDWIWTDVAIR